MNRGRRACPACFLCYFLHAAKSNNPFPFRELSDKQKVCPCRGSTLRVLLLPFSLKHGRLAHIRSQFSLFRRSPTHKNLPLAIFCTSEQGVSRFCKPRFSAPLRGFTDGRAARSFPIGNIFPAFEKQDKTRGVGAPPPTCTREACTNAPRFACIGRLLRKPFALHSK